MNGNVKMKQQKIYNLNEGNLLKAESSLLCCGYIVFKGKNPKNGKQFKSRPETQCINLFFLYTQSHKILFY